MYDAIYVSTHSRLKAAGRRWTIMVAKAVVSTHSRLKAAGEAIENLNDDDLLFQHTAA